MNTKITLVEYVRKGPRSVEGQELHALTRIVLCALDVRTRLFHAHQNAAFSSRNVKARASPTGRSINQPTSKILISLGDLVT